jgi:hypothetical protein
MIIEQLESKIKALPYDKVIPFSYIDIESISIDTRRQYLHRLHDRGLISIFRSSFLAFLSYINCIKILC